MKIHLIPRNDGIMHEIDEPVEADVLMSGETERTVVLADGSFFVENYDPESMRFDRVLYEDSGVTRFGPSIRHGGIEVGTMQVISGDSIVLTRSQKGRWVGSLDDKTKNLLNELSTRIGSTKVVPDVPWE